MYSLSLILCLSGIPAVLGLNQSHLFDVKQYKNVDIIKRDVAIIGGGATGTYAAIGLHDMNKTVVVVERDSAMGGHTRSYKIPGTNSALDFGVRAYNDLEVARKFFARLDIPVVKTTYVHPKTEYLDLNTGDTVLNQLSLPNFTRYRNELEKYPYLEYSLDLPEEVPEDLLMPFGDFVEKHSLEDVVYHLYFATQGMGDLLQQPTFYVFKYFSQQFLDGLRVGVYITERHNNYEIYENAQRELGGDVLASSQVIASERPTNGSDMNLVVKTPGGIKLIQASKLLITIPPVIDNMYPFDLNDNEMSLFQQFQNTGWYVSLVNNTGLPDGITVQSANAKSPYNLPVLPDVYILQPTSTKGVFLVKYGSEVTLPDEFVKRDIRERVTKLSMTMNNDSREPDVEILAYQSHAPFSLSVSPEAIRDGFYRNLTALQGKRNTWYTGNTWMSPHSAAMWNFTEALLPRIMED
ncbi:hypothetical protein AJ80_02380 [Polytolypa hystricis UAMH7299]|uniref:Amine oxidase domain-containing protein n=1 Tax=Polytolypa hystricis (strain UAMH7299) TaxID=1447883 RepID=A0A2B7YRD0_POLH7|nr:hypothetical protein AJ80_02380 [Polytolypa hystricis UAMH7299]